MVVRQRGRVGGWGGRKGTPAGWGVVGCSWLGGWVGIDTGALAAGTGAKSIDLQGGPGGGEAQLCGSRRDLHNQSVCCWPAIALTVANASQWVHTSAADDTACAVVVGTIAVVFLGVKVVQPTDRPWKSASMCRGPWGVTGGVPTWVPHPCNVPCSAFKPPPACPTHMYPAA